MSEEKINNEEMPEIDPKQFEEFMKAFAKVPVMDLIIRDINEFIQKAWMNMGLVPPFGEKEPVINMEDAKLAIDCVEFLTGKLDEKIPEEGLKELKRVLADLQINFVKKSEENK